MAPENERWQFRAQDEHRIAKVRIGRLAAKQFGAVTWAQLRETGVAPGTIRRWVATGYLFRTLPHVYVVGRPSEGQQTRLFSLVLFAGPGAALSHGTCAHWRGWLRYSVSAIHLSTPRRITKLPGVLFHCRRELHRELVNGIPCTTPVQTLLDVAATEPSKLLHRCLAQLDYERKLDRDAILEATGRGRPGSAALFKALDAYMPQLAHTKSELEDEFLYLCRRAKVPIPKVNAQVHGDEVDCYWPDLGLVVELDGAGNHSTVAQRDADQRKALRLRAHGLTVIRYTWAQVFRYPNESILDLATQTKHCGSNMLN